MRSQLTGEFITSVDALLTTKSLDCYPSGSSTPFCTLQFLNALEISKSVGGETGWKPYHLVLYSDAKLCAMIPFYQKLHSYGEYVFDHSWANAYHTHGLAYYPKLVCAIPFTPVTTSKLLMTSDCKIDPKTLWQFAHRKITDEFDTFSSVHYLFTADQEQHYLRELDCHQRQSVQFIFYNQNYADFDDFLARLKSRKRKSIRKERESITHAGVSLRQIIGDSIDSELIDTFYRCYQSTYLKRSGHAGYLTRVFFHELLHSMQEQMLIVVAEAQGEVIASALFLFDNKGLYGRYWGALKEVSGLHFECCYYQGIEFSIANNIPLFNPGTQGEHKILRGFRPTYCYSAHKLANTEFDTAVKDFTQREQTHVQLYMQEACELLPYSHQ